MSKKSKGGAQKKVNPFLNEPEPWIKDSNSKTINDSGFNCFLVILVESRPFYRQLAVEMDKYCQFGYRNCIKCISVDKITEIVFTNCTKNGEATPFSILCDEILKNTGKYFEEKIPIHLYKYLIKYIVLQYKEKRLKEKWISQQNEIDFQNKLKQYANTPKGKGTKSESGKKGDHKGKVQQSQVDKINTELHTRNENYRCLDDIKDEPEGGPDLYIILMQSQNSDLTMELIKLGVPVRSFIQIGDLDSTLFDDDESFKNILSANKKTNDEIENILKQSYLNKTVLDRSFIREVNIRQFWSKILYYMNRKKYKNQFDNVNILKYIPSIPDNPKSAQFVDDLRRSIYDGISSVMFESVILRKLHKEYLGNVKPINVNCKVISHIEDFNYYNKVMKSLPQLLSSVEMVLDSLVAQVCYDLDAYMGYDKDQFEFLQEKVDNDIEPSLSCFQTLTVELGKFNRLSKINVENESQCSTDSLANERTTVFCLEDQMSEIIGHYKNEVIDFIKFRTSYINRLFWDSIIWSKMESTGLETNIFQNLIENNLYDDLKRDILNIFICLIDLKSVGSDQMLEKCTYLKDKNDADKILIRISEIMRLLQFPHSFSVVEPMLSEITYQIFQNSLALCSHYTIQHVSSNDKVIITFSDWRTSVIKSVTLPTVLPLRDFIETILNENEFESNRIMYNKKRYNYTDMLSDKINALIINNFQEKPTPETICDPRKYHSNPEEWIESIYDKVYDKQIRAKYLIKHDNVMKNTERRSFINPVLYDVGIKEKITYNFFDINIKLNEDLEIFLHYWENSSYENYQLSISARLKNHEIRYGTNILPEGFLLEPTDKRKSKLFIEHSSGILFSFIRILNENKEEQDIELPILNLFNFAKSNLSSVNFFKEEKEYNFELNISWPNGLFIQQINKEGLPLYIKQQFLHNKPSIKSFNIEEESFRCILNDGIVIKFMTNDLVIILHSNGRIIKCRQFENVNVNDYADNNYQNETVDKDKQNVKDDDEITDEEDGEKWLKPFEYEVRESDGRIYSTVDEETIEGPPLFVEDFHDVIECSIKTEFSDGVVYTHRSDGSLTVQYLDGTVIVSYAKFSVHEITIDINDGYEDLMEHMEEESSNAKTNFHPVTDIKPLHDKVTSAGYNQDSNDLIFLENLTQYDIGEGSEENYYIDFDMTIPFTVVELTYKIDHPCFATVIFSYGGDTSIIAMPSNIQVKLSNDIHINFNEEIQIYNYKSGIIVQQTESNKVKNEIMFTFENFRNRIENEVPNPCVLAKDSKDNSIFIYDNGKFEINDNINDNHWQNERLFIIDRNYSGFEILSKFKMNKKIISIKKEKNLILRQIKRDKFIEHLLMVPINDLNKWSYCCEYLTIQKTIPMPSTYGNSWCFPFEEKKSQYCKTLEAIAIKYFFEITNIPDLFNEIKKSLMKITSENGQIRSIDNSLSIKSNRSNSEKMTSENEQIRSIDNSLSIKSNRSNSENQKLENSDCYTKNNQISSTDREETNDSNESGGQSLEGEANEDNGRFSTFDSDHLNTENESVTDLRRYLLYNFNQLLMQLKEMLVNKELAVIAFEKGTRILEDECELRDTAKYIKKIVLTKTGQKIEQSCLEKYKIRFDEESFNILNNKILPYFDNAEGTAFVLTAALMTKLFQIDDENQDKTELKQLLFKPLCKITDEDLERIKELFIKLDQLISKDEMPEKYSLDQVLVAGKKLEKYFTNMNDVLQFHKIMKDYINDDRCS